MQARTFLRAFVAAVTLAVLSVSASAQVAQLTGKVTLKQADGTEVPVQNAIVDIYRTDISGKWQVKTDRKGVYLHAGLPFVGTFTIAVSAPNARPSFQSRVRVSQRPEINFALEPGDGTRLTLDDIKKFEAGGGGAPASAGTPGAAPAARSESAEEKASREELERKVKEIEAKNANIEQNNQAVARAFKAGNDALNARNYDAAISHYDEGLAARDEIALFANKSVALRQRGVDRFNAAIKADSAEAKSSGMAAAYKDWVAAAEAAQKGVDMLAVTTPPTDATSRANFDTNRLATINAHAEAMRLVATKADKSRAEEAFKVYSDYAAMETDPAKKSQKVADAAKILFEAGAYDRAAAEYRKILEADPDNAEANLYLGFSLFNTGDKDKFQEAANYLGKFNEKAAASHPLKSDVAGILDYLRTSENVRPERTQPTRSTGGRRRP